MMLLSKSRSLNETQKKELTELKTQLDSLNQLKKESNKVFFLISI